MKKRIIVGIIFVVLLIAVVAISWRSYPTWRDPANGGFWGLFGTAAVAILTFISTVVTLWKDLKDNDKKDEVPTPQTIQKIEKQEAENIFNAPGGTLNVDIKGTIHEQDYPPPNLELKLLDEMKQYVDELTFFQTINTQDFRFSIALINSEERSLPAEKLEITIECSWDGIEIKKSPKFKTDTHNRTTPGWTAKRELIQQGEIPYPAKLSFHGLTSDRCAFGHSLEWHRFSVALFEKMRGRFALNYKITSAYPKLVNAQGILFIHINPEDFGTKSIIVNDILSNEKLSIKFNIAADKVEINGELVKRVRALESNENQIVFSPTNSEVSKLYHLSREQIEKMKAL